uniref:Chromo domain-containing protein n=1 Tax=Amphimedon queenslandica TaxID=400682 RepID=A0A1X7V1E4_AMPQE
MDYISHPRVVFCILVLWKGYYKEQATWLPAKDITAKAIRLYNEPQPCQRVLMDDISSLRSALQSSLKCGILRRHKICIPFHRHTFNYLIQKIGRPVPRKPGRLYERNDFASEHFEESFFTFYNKYSEACCVVFPVYMYSYVAFHQKLFHAATSP